MILLILNALHERRGKHMQPSCVNWIRLNIQYSMLLHEDTNNLFIYLLYYLSK